MVKELDKRSPDSLAMTPYWDKAADIIDGEDAVKASGEKWLPKFANEEKETYNNRLSYAKFTNIFRDVVEGLSTKPFEEEVSLVGDNIPSEITQFIEDVDGSGNNMTAFAGAAFFNSIAFAIHWIFVDHADFGANVPRTKAEEKAAGARPYWTHILGRNVLEVKAAIVQGKERIVYFKIAEGDKIRLLQHTSDNVVTWELYRKDDNDPTEWILEKNGTISIGRIAAVPIICGRRDGKRFYIYPPMKDAADLQMHLYHSESGLEWLKVLAAYPMLCGMGISPKMQGDKPVPLARGPGQILYSPPNNGGGQNGEWKYIEPSATSLTFLAGDIKDIKQDLRELGRQPLTAQSAQLTVITTAVAAGKAASAVKQWSLGLKDALENAFVFTALYMGIKYEAEVNVFDDFDDFDAEGKDLSELGSARGRNDISRETYWAELKRRGVLSAEFNPDQETERLLAEVPGDDDPNDNNSV